MFRALSLIQPFASLIAASEKRIETRSWATTYRGPLAIHASKGFPQEYQELLRVEPFRSVLFRDGYGWGMQAPWVRHDESLPRGAIVAVADLVDCNRTERYLRSDIWRNLPPHEKEFGDYTEGRYGLLLANVRRLAEPVPCRGALSLWEVPADVEARIREQVTI